MEDEPTRREADTALVDLQQGVADLQGQHAQLHAAHEETRAEVRNLNFAVFGLPGTDEKGLLGEVRETNAKLDDIRDAIFKLALSLVASSILFAAGVALM